MKGKEMPAMESASSPGMRVYVLVWVGLLLIVAVEVAMTYFRPWSGVLVARLLVLAVLEAALGLMYFMHLRYERPLLFWSLIPVLLFVLLMMNQFWTDAHRLSALRP
jgi:caa(3)-type oxidase subunit IV